MSQAYSDLMTVRGLFEQFERNLATNVDKSAAKYGLSKTLSVAADVARIRKELHDLSLKMFPPKTEDEDTPMTDEEYESYIG